MRIKFNEKGEKMGPWIEVYDSGEISGRGNYINGKKDGEWIGYKKDGTIWCKGNYIDGKKDGEWLEAADQNKGYYTYSFIWCKGNYIDGKKDGEWKQYKKDGKIPYAIIYMDGKEIGINEFKGMYIESKEDFPVCGLN